MMAAEGYTPTGQAVKRPSICHSCKREVVWCVLERKKQPLDYLGVSSRAGDVALEPELFARPDGSHELVRATFSGTGTSYRRHIESCPDADKWRLHWMTKNKNKREAAQRAHSTIERKKTR